MPLKSSTPDAQFSSAGDNFHLLWAIKKSLQLLNFKPDGLKAVSIESPGKALSDKIDPQGDLLLGIDLVEYYGGEDFYEASKIVVSQLKYSTRRPRENWTFSRLYRGKKASSFSGSVIHRLASLYKAFASEFDKTEVQSKLKIKLVSNQPINSSQYATIKSIQETIRKSQRPFNFKKTIKGLSNYQEAFEKLLEASTLDVFTFSDFFQLLDFEECGADSRQRLEFDLVRSIEKISIHPRNPYNALTKLILEKMNPEGIENPGINLYDLLGTLNFSDPDSMFPVPQYFQKPERTIHRVQLREILKKVKEATLPICLHGKAGIGKSVITQQIQDELPSYAFCLTFDCYGNGAYLDPSDRRHMHRKGLVYLGNSLAKELGTDFLINDEQPSDVLLSAFKKRLRQAIEILQARNSKAFLVLIIDAADNNLHAAQKYQEPSFVKDLLEEPLPIACKLIVTCRTHRRKELPLPEHYIDIPIEPFQLQETREYLLHYFPNSLEQDITEFHQLSKGIPRVQSYAMDLRKEGVHEVVNYLKPHGKKVADIIAVHIQEAGKRIGRHGQQIINDFFTYLISLPRPVPQEYLSDLMNVSKGALEDLASDIWHGLVLEEEHFSFRDEDFENYIRKQYPIEQQKKINIAELFLIKADEDEYATTNLGFSLYDAGKIKTLIDIVLDNQYRKFPLDPVRNRQVFIERSRLAMIAANQEENSLKFYKLLLIAAEESKTDKALRNILLQHPDLAYRFGEEESLHQIDKVAEGEGWAGSLHMKLAGLYSRDTSKQELAKNHMDIGRKWLAWRRDSVPEKELKEYPINYSDIAFETEAIIRLVSPDAGYRSLRRWNPPEVKLHVGQELLDELLQHTPFSQIEEWVQKSRLPYLVQLFITVKLWDKDQPITAIDHESILCFLEKLINQDFRFNSITSVVLVKYLEILIFNRLSDPKRVRPIVAAIPFQRPNRVPIFYSKPYANRESEQEVELALRIMCLLAAIDSQDINIKDLYPKNFSKIKNEKDYKIRHALEKEKSEYESFFTPALSAYKLRADWICFHLTKQKALDQFQAICTSVANDWRYRAFTYNVQEQLNFLGGLLAEVCLLFESANKWIPKILEVFIFQSNEISLRTKLLEILVQKKTTHRSSLELLYEIEQKIIQKRLNASQATEIFISCAKFGGYIDIATGKHYFEKTIEVVADIDLEAYDKIAAIYHLTQHGIGEPNPKLAYQFAKFIEYADEKLTGYDKKHFPYLPGMEAIYQLDPASLFPVLCRWHHRDMLDLTEYTLPLVHRMFSDGLITTELAAVLFLLDTESYYRENTGFIEDLLIQWSRDRDFNQLNYYCSILFRELQLYKNLTQITILRDACKKIHGVENSLLDQMESYISFRNTVNPEKQSSYKNDFSLEEFIYPEELLEIDISAPEEIENAILKLYNKDEYSRNWTISKYLRDLGAAVDPNQYVTFLKAITRLSPKLVGSYELREHLKDYLEKWIVHPGVRKWRQEAFPRIAKLWFKTYREDRNVLSYLKDLADIFEIDSSYFAEILRKLLPEEINYLEEEVIYQSFQLLAPLPSDQNRLFITWILSKWTLGIDEDVADGTWKADLTPPSDPRESVAGLVHFLLGHPDKRLRWKAVHLLRHSINLEDTTLVTLLLKAQDKKNITPFQEKKFVFYSVSAKLYLWIAIARVSEENPACLLEFSEEFLEELVKKDPPHVLIRSLIKQTCLNLVKAETTCYTTEEQKLIEQQLVSEISNHTSVEEYIARVEAASKSKLQFSFDHLDTLPYWYHNLGRAFNIGEFVIAKEADRIIREEFGYQGDVNADDYIHKQLHSSNYHLTSKRQNNLPTIEDLQTYFEYHAMFCVAQRLLDSVPESNPDDSWTSFHSWLEHRGVTWKHYWLSDIRDPLPLEARYWVNKFNHFDKEWRDKIPDSYFDQQVGFEHFWGCNRLTVYGQESRFFRENTETVSIHSALVTEKTAEALLRALQTAKDPYDYVIPFEEDVYGHEVEETGFSFKGWLRSTGPEGSGLDKHEPLARNIGNSYIAFGERVQNTLDITYDTYYKRAFHKGREVAQYQQWEETTERNFGLVESSGTIFRVDIELILKLLQEFRSCLLLRCVIDRQLKERIYRADRREKDFGNIVKFYLIKPNGQVKTLRGSNYQLREKVN